MNNVSLLANHYTEILISAGYILMICTLFFGIVLSMPCRRSMKRVHGELNDLARRHGILDGQKKRGSI